MKNIIFLISSLMMGYSVYAQEFKSVSFDPETLRQSNLELSANWMVSIENNNVTAGNGRITNKSARNSKELALEIYLSTEPFSSASGKVEGFPAATIKLKSLTANAALAGISIQATVNNQLPEGDYFPVLVLYEAGEIKNIRTISSYVNIDGNHVVSVKSKKTKPEESIGRETAVEKEIIPSNRAVADMSGVTDPNQAFQFVIQNDNSISFENDWKIEIDFKNFLVTLTGGDISNNSVKDIDHLKVDVFLTSKKQSFIFQNFDGLLIASAPFDFPIKAGNSFLNTAIKTNLRAIPPTGTYYIMMAVSETGNDGKTYLKNTRILERPVTF